MSCNFWDDCSTCTVGRSIGCGSWDEVEHEYDDHDSGEFYDCDDSYAYGNNDDYDEYDVNADEDDEDISYCNSDEDSEMHNGTKCTACGAPVQEEWKYCFYCGSHVFGKYCVGCGRRLKSEWEYCPNCGTRVPQLHSEEFSTTSAHPFVEQQGRTTSGSSVDYDKEIPF